MEHEDFRAQVSSIGALAEPTRLALYRYVAGAAAAVSREQAADDMGIALHSVKFHLDRLVEEGLLEVEYRRLTGRTGPGAGRPSKLYRRTTRQLVRLAAGAAIRPRGRSARSSRRPVGAPWNPHRRGGTERGARHRLTDRGRPDSPRRTGRAATTARLIETLTDHGYEPRFVDEDVCLTNCPFDRLAAEHTELVCGMNLALVDGVIEGLNLRAMSARLEPQPGFCCVKVATKPVRRERR